MADPKNPSGALPGDPRHGLSEEELKRYYATKAPCWCVRALLGPDGGPRRKAALDPHLAYLRSLRKEIRFAGPIMEADGETACGSLTLIDLPDRAAAQAYIDNEPYNRNGAFDRIEIMRWSSSMQIRQLDTKRTQGWQQFLVIAMDHDDGPARRAAVNDAHHKFQATVMDRYVARGPLQTDGGTRIVGSLMIVELQDRAACDAFWAAEPLSSGGVFKSVSIERWRYGAAIG
jgi:uncharacterized protein